MSQQGELSGKPSLDQRVSIIRTMRTLTAAFDTWNSQAKVSKAAFAQPPPSSFEICLMTASSTWTSVWLIITSLEAILRCSTYRNAFIVLQSCANTGKAWCMQADIHIQMPGNAQATSKFVRQLFRPQRRPAPARAASPGTKPAAAKHALPPGADSPPTRS